MYHHFSSKFLVDSLHSHEFCSSYSTVQKYERSAAETQETDITRGYTPDLFVQYVAGNVDHNTRTLDGKGTFHGMGIKSVPKKAVTADEIDAAGRIDIHHYKGPNEDVSQLLYKELSDLRVQDTSIKPLPSLKADSTSATISAACMVGHNADDMQGALPWPIDGYISPDD